MDLYVTLVAAIAFGVLGLVGNASQEVVTSGILAILALVTISLLRLRSQGEKINQSLAEIKARPSADRFFSEVDDRDEIREMISSSREVWLHGWTLGLHLVSYADEIRRAVTKGLHIKILVIEPHSTAMSIAASEAENRSADELSSNLEANLRRLAAPITGTVAGRLEIKTLSYVPHNTVIASDPSTKQGKIVMRIATFHADHWQRPTFTVTRQNDPGWYDFFKTQFERKWESGHLYVSLP
ncbi:hypothetical protein J2Z21_000877 [Streptomyces griseochromogenes]|uniref:Uncharacterized protein n=1 Tax=Streptomyces griseochromogenes TaxID=68214 RepID=A0ABS4LKQ2_9ACTN|nr:hypothetical protein [Streptomyces griseochromogenes]MBP2047953.1 hypothetical protein [Streptomyces griseochromogenes]